MRTGALRFKLIGGFCMVYHLVLGTGCFLGAVGIVKAPKLYEGLADAMIADAGTYRGTIPLLVRTLYSAASAAVAGLMLVALFQENTGYMDRFVSVAAIKIVVNIAMEITLSIMFHSNPDKAITEKVMETLTPLFRLNWIDVLVICEFRRFAQIIKQGRSETAVDPNAMPAPAPPLPSEPERFPAPELRENFKNFSLTSRSEPPFDPNAMPAPAPPFTPEPQPFPAPELCENFKHSSLTRRSEPPFDPNAMPAPAPPLTPEPQRFPAPELRENFKHSSLTSGSEPPLDPNAMPAPAPPLPSEPEPSSGP